jgi:hypothetical protein
MRIYTPYNSVKLNAAVLDEKTLGGQCNSSITILETLRGRSKGWQWHPGVTMWQGYEDLLVDHAVGFIKTWTAPPMNHPDLWTPKLAKLGYFRQIDLLTKTRYVRMPKQSLDMPWWWGNQMFHMSNQSALLRIEPDWYDKFLVVPNDICDWWPLAEEGKFKYGPQPAPGDAGFGYIVDGKPVYKQAKAMTNAEFADHANAYHNLTPDLKAGIARNMSDEMRSLFVALHDRFHQLRVYQTHDHT